MNSLLTHAAANGLCSRQEYEAVLHSVESYSPANVLVFGLGYDALLWITASGGGHVHFIENSAGWIKRCAPIPNVHKVEYRTKGLRQDVIHSDQTLKMELSPEIEKIGWHVIFVDGPVGRTQGRMKSIYNAYRLASKGATVFVHDYNRPCEKLYTDHYFGDYNIEVIDRLAKIQL